MAAPGFSEPKGAWFPQPSLGSAAKQHGPRGVEAGSLPALYRLAGWSSCHHVISQGRRPLVGWVYPIRPVWKPVQMGRLGSNMAQLRIWTPLLSGPSGLYVRAQGMWTQNRVLAGKRLHLNSMQEAAAALVPDTSETPRDFSPSI